MNENMKDKIVEGIIKGFSIQDILDGIKACDYDDIEKYLKQNELIKLWEEVNQIEYDISALKIYLTDFNNSTDPEERQTIFNEIVKLIESIKDDIRNNI